LEAERLPPLYFGNNFVAVAEKLLDLPDKGQFETSDAHKARLQKMVDTSRLYAFIPLVDEDDDLLPCIPKYNADRQAWEVACSMDKITLSSNEKFVGSRVGFNAFGVKVRIKSYQIYKLQIENYSEAPRGFRIIFDQPTNEAIKLERFSIGCMGIDQQFPNESPKYAQCDPYTEVKTDLNNKIKPLFIGRISPLSGTHFIGEVRDTAEATIDDPIEVYTTTHKIQMKLVGGMAVQPRDR
jgi:hypothetical protein